MSREPIAIIGVGCRFPGGASGPGAFWRLLSNGVDAVKEVPADRWNADAYYDPAPGRCGKSITRWGGFVDDIERFDPGFFGISPREAAFMDPQQRMLLEVSWEALEDAGQIAASLRGSPTGVFVGISTHDYELLQSSPDERSDIDVYSTTGGVMSIAANRISYCFDLRGPSLAIDTACSSSLVAVHFACASLWSRSSSLALVGGVNALLAPMPFVAFSRMSMLSPTGRCRAFDAAADGFVRGEGAGVIVLKPLEAARRDGDRIYAVIRGTATNQDGRTNGITVPSAAAQAALVRAACRSAGVDPAAIRYVEAHGTGTPIGDPIEARALGEALGEGRSDGAPCIVGSVKTNIGHLEAGAGIAGIIKLALLLERGEIPPNLHFREPNPNIDFDGLKLRVPTRSQELRSVESNGAEILAGINSFGFGGRNAHAVLQALPKPPRRRLLPPVEAARAELLTISARGAEPLRSLAESYRAYLGSADGREASLEDICWSAATSRTHHEQRLALVARSHGEMIARLCEATASEDAFAAAICEPMEEARRGIAFVFCGQGSQWWAMGRRLLREEPVFRDKLAECDRLLAERAGWRLLEELARDEASSRLSETAIAQPAIFSLQVALAALWESWGIRPTAAVGHSVGEVAAAHVSGALDLGEAARVIFERGRTMDLAPERGRMLAVQLDPGDVEEVIRPYDGGVALGAINGPASVTLSGGGEMLDAIRRDLESRGVVCRLLQVNYAFHSRQMDPVRNELVCALGGSRGAATRIPLISTVTGSEIEGEDLDPQYWWRNVRETVRFAPAIERLIDRGWRIFLDVGPHPVLAGPVAECLRRHGCSGVVLPSLRRQGDERTTLLGSLGRLHACGIVVDWRGVFAGAGAGARVALPSYAWQRDRFWHESEGSRLRRLGPPSPPLLGRALRAALPGWEGWLDKEAMPYLLDHRVQGAAVFPAAGYVEVALEVAEQRIGDPPWLLEDVDFQRALIVPEGDAPARLQTLFQPEDSSFAISSSPATAASWTTHCTGKLRAWAHPPPVEPAGLARLRARCPERVAPSDFYGRLRSAGLDFGPAFRAIEELWRRDGEALAHLRLTEAVAHERSRYRLHPALLDACFQALSAALPRSAFGENGALYLPVHVERVRVRSLAKTPAWSHARLVENSGNAIVGDLRLLDESGEVLVEVAGFRCQGIARHASSENPNTWIYESRWQLAPLTVRAGSSLAADFLPSSRAIAREARDVLERRQHAGSPRSLFLRVESRIDELCAGYAARALRSLGWRPHARRAWTTDALAAELGIAAEHRAVLARHLGYLADDGAVIRKAGRWSLRRALPDVDCAAFWLRILRRFPGLLPELTLIRRSGEALAAILRGEQDALDALAPGGSPAVLEELYQDAPSFADYNRAVAAAVGRAIADLPVWRTVRILEVGAGTGGLTTHVLARLPPERAEYVFTDLSPHFLSRAEQKFFDRPFVRYRSLDLEKPPLEQGFEAHSFDIALASDAVHATARVHESLASLHSLLAPGGLLILLEIDRPTRWIDLVFGLTPGWWRFQDGELRTSHPLLDRSHWKGALARAGFVGVEALADSLGPRRSGQSLFVARTPSRPLARAPAPVESGVADRAGNWLLLADRGGLGARLASLLEAGGDRVTLAFAGPSGRGADARSVGPDPGSPEELRRLLAEVGPSLTGIVHLWGLDAAALTSTRDLEDAETLGCHTVLHLVQALAERSTSEPPRLCLVTRGSQPAGDGIVVSPAQAPLWGLGRVIQNEHRRLGCRMVDLDPQAGDADARCLLEELRAEDPEQEVAWRGGVRYSSRLERAPLDGRARRARETAAYRVEIPSPGSLDQLCWRGRPRRRPGRGEVEIEIDAAAINFRDIMKALAIYPIRSDEDLLVGDECAGRIVAVGPGVGRWREGDHVVAMAAGCFASHLTVGAHRVMRRPRGLTAEEAVTIPVAFLTAWYALYQMGRMRPGERVLIHAATGGVGLAALQVARLARAEIIATAGSPEKRELLRALGVDHVMDSRGLSFADEILEATGGRGVDLVLNSLAGEAITKGLSALAPHGRFLEIGKRDVYQNTRIGLRPFRNGLSMFVIDLPQVLRDQHDLVRTLMARILARFATRELTPLPHRILPISEAVNAFRSVAKAQHIGKVVLSMDDPAVRLRIEARPAPARFAREATYLVSGGLGGFGLAVAEWMVEHGARHVVLAGRSGAVTAPSRAVLRSLRRRGARVVVAKLDVADEQAVARLMRRLERSAPRLRGVVHAAMVLDDGVLTELDAGRFRSVMKPKMQGAWNLHVHTLDQRLDFFVLFSSVSSMVGAPAQGSYVAANSFLDALAHYRRGLGLPALAINWGQLSEVGYVARHERVERHLSRQGILGIAPRLALDILGRLLRGSAAQIGVVRVDWQRWASFLPGVAAAPRFAHLIEAAASEIGSEGRSARDVILDAPPEERPGLLVNHVRDQVGRVLRTAAAKLDTRRPLAELGVDSLMAFELINRLEAQFAVALQPGRLSGEVTIETAAAALLDLLAASTSANTAPAKRVPTARRGAADARFLTLRAGDEATALFCVHPAGGLGNIYKGLAERLSSGIAVHALQSRALYDGLEEHSSLAELAEEYAATIAARSVPSGYRLLGFSLGGLLALAVARALEERGERVAFLGLIDSDFRLTDPASRTDGYVRSHIVDMYGTLARELSAVRPLEPRELAREAASLSQRVLCAPHPERSRAIVEWLRERGHLAPELSPAMVDRYFSLFEAHVALVEGFVPPRISAPLFVWERARPDDRGSEIWRTCTSASVERAVVAGNHYDLMFPPLVEVLAAGIDAALRRVVEAAGEPLGAHLDRREG